MNDQIQFRRVERINRTVVVDIAGNKGIAVGRDVIKLDCRIFYYGVIRRRDAAVIVRVAAPVALQTTGILL